MGMRFRFEKVEAEMKALEVVGVAQRPTPLS
jgi:hypothetical protein